MMITKISIAASVIIHVHFAVKRDRTIVILAPPTETGYFQNIGQKTTAPNFTDVSAASN